MTEHLYLDYDPGPVRASYSRLGPPVVALLQVPSAQSEEKERPLDHRSSAWLEAPSAAHSG